MNQSPTGTQLPNGVQSPTETPASGKPLRLSEFPTPFGEPMDQPDTELCEKFRDLCELRERLRDLDENGVESPTENPASGKTLRLSEFRTPFGEPMHQPDAELCERFRDLRERLRDLDENGVQSTTQNLASGDALRLSEFQTPLGKSMDQLDAEMWEGFRELCEIRDRVRDLYERLEKSDEEQNLRKVLLRARWNAGEQIGENDK
ncbi:hypothetical protein MMC22_001671 [Lobaria immixta]|nr:hypothetical protein [Lobaria immixta]